MKDPFRGPHRLLINNEWCDSRSGKRFAVYNPATEEVICQVSEAGAEDVDAAVRAARYAFDHGPWAKFSPRERGRLLLRVAQLVDKHKEELAHLETLNNGKPIRETRGFDVPQAVDTLEYYAGWADKIEGETIPVGGQFLNYTVREAVGVVGQIIPWNFPLLMAAWKLGPALAAGCCVVLKPAEQSPLTALRLGELLLEAGMPPGVVNIVPGFGPTAGAALASHMDVDKLAFTGSTEVGRLVMKMAAASNLKRVSLELGGKAPHIVLADADLDAAVKGAMLGIFFNQGEVCCAGSRLFVAEQIKDAFLYKLKEHVERLVVGDPTDPNTQMGAQASKEQYERILKYIAIGREEGAKLMTGGEPLGSKGYFIKPTVFDQVSNDMQIAKEEIFGPVASVISFKDEASLCRLANDTVYGLSAGIWTKELSRAHGLAKALKAGTVWVNCYNTFDAAVPFGGFKQSGFGRELGKHALDLYTAVKAVWVALD